VPIDPIELKLEERVFETARLRGIFGALRDAGPDYWAGGSLKNTWAESP